MDTTENKQNQNANQNQNQNNNSNGSNSAPRGGRGRNHQRHGHGPNPGQGNQNGQGGQNKPKSRPQNEQKPRVNNAQPEGERPADTQPAQPVQGAPRQAREAHTVWSSGGRRRPNRPVAPAQPAAPSNQAVKNSQPSAQPQPEAPKNDARPQAPRQNEPFKDADNRSSRIPGQRPPRMPHRPNRPQELPQMDNLLIEDVPAESAVSDTYTPDSAELERILQYEALTPQARAIPDVIPDGKVVIVGVRFRTGGKTYFFDPGRTVCPVGQHAIVETARGLEYGEVCLPNCMVDESLVIPPLRPLIRIATEEDIAHNRENHEKEAEAYRIGVQKIRQHKLDMKLVTAQYTFDNAKLLFYFTSAGRVDFRELVRDLASVFHIRIELRQIGIRDEARMIGGLGACGRPLCCSTFLSDFGQVSMKMAKEQNLSLNSSKISGVCGRLMCCLRYEYDTYQEEIRRTPAPGTFVMTPDGPGVVTEIFPLPGEVKVSLRREDEAAPKRYKREDVTVQAPGPRPGESASPAAADAPSEDTDEPDSNV